MRLRWPWVWARPVEDYIRALLEREHGLRGHLTHLASQLDLRTGEVCMARQENGSLRAQITRLTRELHLARRAQAALEQRCRELQHANDTLSRRCVDASGDLAVPGQPPARRPDAMEVEHR